MLNRGFFFQILGFPARTRNHHIASPTPRPPGHPDDFPPGMATRYPVPWVVGSGFTESPGSGSHPEVWCFGISPKWLKAHAQRSQTTMSREKKDEVGWSDWMYWSRELSWWTRAGVGSEVCYTIILHGNEVLVGRPGTAPYTLRYPSHTNLQVRIVKRCSEPPPRKEKRIR